MATRCSSMSSAAALARASGVILASLACSPSFRATIALV
jgi:hypothetical protein